MKRFSEKYLFENFAFYLNNVEEVEHFSTLLSIAEKNYSKELAEKNAKKIVKFLKKIRKKGITKQALIFFLQNQTK